MFPNINAEQARNNMTNRQLAEKLAVSERTITNWKSGRTDIPSAKLIKMAGMFNCTTDYLLATDAQ